MNRLPVLVDAAGARQALEGAATRAIEAIPLVYRPIGK